ncbi:HDOD domain-containing protein [Planctomycetota bacterium]
MNQEPTDNTTVPSKAIRYTGFGAPAPPAYKIPQRKAIFRSLGVLLNFCKDYIGPDTDMFIREEDWVAWYAKEKKVAEAVRRFSKAEQKKVRNKLQETKAQAPDAEVIKQLTPAVKVFIKAARTIKKKGGNISLDMQQLLQNLKVGGKKYPDDALIASLYRKLSASPSKSRGLHDATDVFRKIKETGKLPTPAHKAFKIFRLAHDENTHISDLAAVVATDPAIAARVLKVANSAFYKSLNPISSVHEAIIRMGLKMIKRISLGLSLISPHKKGPCVDFDYEMFWSESLARAVVARSLTEFKQSDFNSEEAFTVGLLCQIGRLSLATVYPQEYAQVLGRTNPDHPASLKENEREFFGIDHNELSAEMMTDLRLPNVFCQAVRFQDSMEFQKNLTPGTPEYELAGLLQWPAKTAVILTQTGAPREFLESVIREAEQLGLAGNKLAPCFDSMVNEWREMGDILEVKTRKVLPWKEIYAQVSQG